MSRENVELVRRSNEVFNRDGVAAISSSGLWSPRVVFDFSQTGIPGLGVYRGYDEIKGFFEEDWFAAFPFEQWVVEIEQFVDHGDQVIAVSRQSGRGSSSGAAAELEFVQIITVQDGEILRDEFYLDRTMALEAAGLAE
jgi:ketosteroid isomerase-like protein